MRRKIGLFLAMVAATAVQTAAAPAADKVVGVWLVRQEGAPFPMHMYVFNADGTLQQANPDAGNPRVSDSDAKGIWFRRDRKIVGKWVEISADRATHHFIGRGELTFELILTGNRLTGSSTFRGFDANGKPNIGPIMVPFEGSRVTFP